ncbi:MAG: putative oxidoreductase [Gammaproteobacteria bacterium]|jgi:putative oxidoreductase
MSESNNPSQQAKLELSLFLLRLGVFVVMIAWTLDKFIDPAHAARVYEGFYFIGGLGYTVMMIIGGIEIIIILAFLAGLWKRYTYGFVMIIHGVSTFSAWERYTIDISLLFFAAWPMLAACIALYLLRDSDVKFTLGKK